MQLTILQYNVLMMALGNAKAAIADGDFIDPYAEDIDEYSDAEMLKAIDDVEKMIIKDNTPF